MPIPIEPAVPAVVAGLTGRLQFPATDDRLVYKNNGNNLPFLSQAGITVTVYTDAGGTVLADIVDSAGVAITGSVLTVDANSQIPLFFGPVGIEVLYVKTTTGPVEPIFAWLQGRYNTYDARFVANEANIAALQAADAIHDTRLGLAEGRLTAVETKNTTQDSRLLALEIATPTGAVIDGGTT